CTVLFIKTLSARSTERCVAWVRNMAAVTPLAAGLTIVRSHSCYAHYPLIRLLHKKIRALEKIIAYIPCYMSCEIGPLGRMYILTRIFTAVEIHRLCAR